MDTLAALCDIFECTPSDLIEVEAVRAQRRQATGGARPSPPPVQRTTIRRPQQD